MRGFFESSLTNIFSSLIMPNISLTKNQVALFE